MGSDFCYTYVEMPRKGLTPEDCQQLLNASEVEGDALQ